MKITNNNIIKNYTDLRIHTKDNSTPPTVSNDGHSFDEVIIKSNPREIEEHTFAKSLSRKLSSEVNTIASAEKIEQLQGQISAHTYQIDAYSIASRMLLI